MVVVLVFLVRAPRMQERKYLNANAKISKTEVKLCNRMKEKDRKQKKKLKNLKNKIM
jgi:hypothetical protein